MRHRSVVTKEAMIEMIGYANQAIGQLGDGECIAAELSMDADHNPLPESPDLEWLRGIGTEFGELFQRAIDLRKAILRRALDTLNSRDFDEVVERCRFSQSQETPSH